MVPSSRVAYLGTWLRYSSLCDFRPILASTKFLPGNIDVSLLWLVLGWCEQVRVCCYCMSFIFPRLLASRPNTATSVPFQAKDGATIACSACAHSTSGARATHHNSYLQAKHQLKYIRTWTLLKIEQINKRLVSSINQSEAHNQYKLTLQNHHNHLLSC